MKKNISVWRGDDHKGDSMVRQWWARRYAMARTKAEVGMATAEYAMGTIAACAFAAVLYKVVTSGAVSGALRSVIGRALHAQF